ncbi:reverse transcriptase, partial [Phytophthora megakarya]
PRAKIDDALAEIAPRKEPKRRIQAPIPTVDRDEELWVVRFDGSTRVKRGGGAFSAIVWSLPGWEVVKARSGYLENLTVNEAEYNGLISGLDMLEGLDRRRLVICGDSNLVIRQVRGEIDCKAPGLTLLKRKALDRLRKWNDHELVHVKRDWNGSADSLASAALQRQRGIEVQETPGHQDLRHEEVSKWLDRGSHPNGIKTVSYGKIAADYEVDEQDLLFYCPPTSRSGDDRDRMMRLVVPETLQSDVLHHYHATLEGGHQGVGRTYQRIRDHFHWRGLYRSVQRYVRECVDCETGKGKPVIRGESPGNLRATYPFQIIAMDHIPSLPRQGEH